MHCQGRSGEIKSIVVSVYVSNEALYLVDIVQSDDVIEKGVQII